MAFNINELFDLIASNLLSFNVTKPRLRVNYHAMVTVICNLFNSQVQVALSRNRKQSGYI